MHRNVADGEPDKSQGTILHELLNSGLPPAELSVDRLVDEAVSVVGAGIETTKWILALTFFYILDSPNILTRLQRELESYIPDSSTPPPLSELEQLPWLMACINEGKRSLSSLQCSQTFEIDLRNRSAPWIRRDDTISANLSG